VSRHSTGSRLHTTISVDPSGEVVIVSPSTTYTVSLPQITGAEEIAVLTLRSMTLTATSEDRSVVVGPYIIIPIKEFGLN